MEAGKESVFQGVVKKTSRGYTWKCFLLTALVLLLLIPLSMIDELISERRRTADSAAANIMEAWGGELIAAGPVLAVPGVRKEESLTKTARNEEIIAVVEKPFTLFIAPRQLAVDAKFTTEIRYRGIFSVPLFSGRLALSGSFNPAPALAALAGNETVFLEQARLVIGLSSLQGIRKIERALWNRDELSFLPGVGGDFLSGGGQERSKSARPAKPRPPSGGIHANLPDGKKSEAKFDIVVAIQGGKQVRFLPVGQDTHVVVAADWASPSFQGAFLPGGSNITGKGFDAVWDISYLSRDIPLFWKSAESGPEYSAALFGVDFFRAVDTYSLNTKAVKFAILFLLVPFCTLFLLEVAAKKRIHPVSYLLSGLANIIFYLLLLSFSEHMRFHFAYLTAALAVTAAMTLYARSLLSSWRNSWGAGLTASLSYILLYAALNAESYALLIGSIGAFAAVAAGMFLTRKFDWYEAGS